MKLLFVGFTNQQIADYRKIAAPAEIVTLDTGAEGEVPDIGAEALIGATRAVFDKVFTPETWRIRPSIRWYHAPGAGIEFYMFPGIADQSFVLTNGKLIQGPEVADHAVGLLLALTRRLLWSLKAPGAEMSRPVELRGKRALVIGLGGIGMLVAERLAGFGMQIDTVTEDYVPFLGFIQRRWMSDQLLDALPSADVVIMAAPLTTMSKKMMGSAAFDRMKQGSYFVNVSRGGTVDTESLLAAVKSGKLAGVGLDVTDPEPLPTDHPLHTFPNVLVLPHLAGISDNLRVRSFELIGTNLRRFVAGLPLINVVDKQRGY